MPNKNIVICCDGTGNELGEHNTNVVLTFEKIERNNQQIGFYDPGVGTFDVFGFKVGKMAKKVGTLYGLAFGTGMVKNVEDAYEYLMDKYEEGDKVYIFGFSRGAFTARVLAGMIHKCGLLQKGSNNLISYASRVHFTKDNKTTADRFKKAFCHECKPHFLGVWDTVASLGYVHSLRKFSDNNLNPDVKNAFHAISIDEKRKKFPISLWDESNIPKVQTIEQVWFSGVHSDVGGSYPDKGLSDIALEWMLTNAEKKGLKLKQGWRSNLDRDPHWIADNDASPPTQSITHDSRTGLWKCWCWPPVNREIPDISNQYPKGSFIHQSVMDKIKFHKKNYSPNLPDKYTVVDNDYSTRS